jgi:hypothetical protein
MGKTRKSQKATKASTHAVPLTPVPVPSVTKTGRQRTYSSKQMENGMYSSC